MKCTLKYLLLLPPLLLSQYVAAVTYPSRQGAKVQRKIGGDNIAIRLSPRTTRNYHAVTSAQTYSQATGTAISSGTKIYTGSDAMTASYGGGTNTDVGNIASQNNAATITTTTGAVATLAPVARTKSATSGSTFASTETPALASGYVPSALRGDQNPPPPPGPGGDNTGENQLPIGNGIGVLLLLSGAFLIRKLKLGMRNVEISK